MVGRERRGRLVSVSGLAAFRHLIEDDRI